MSENILDALRVVHNITTLDVTGAFSSIASYATDTLAAEVVQIVETDGVSILP